MSEIVNFGDRLADACTAKKSPVCVGLDPRWQSLPEAIRAGVDASDLGKVAAATQCFCQEVLDAVAPLAPIVKPQAAFFEQLGPAGGDVLWRVIQYARRLGLLVLLDAKRGDIGSTAEGYADAYLGSQSPWQCDALTVNPYLGDDTLVPFTQTAERRGAGVFVLVKTSNPGSGFLQDRMVDGLTLFQQVANHVQESSMAALGQSGYGSVGAVVGATYPEQLSELRARMPNVWILIPGFGAQGGSAEDVKYGFQERMGAIVNSSRGIIFAYQNAQYDRLNWQDAVATAAQDMRDQIMNAL